MRWLLCSALVFALHALGAEPGAAASCALPLQFRDGLLWLEVSVPQSKESLHFLLDSGASVSVLDLSAAQRLRVPLGPKVKVTAVAAKLTGHWPVKLSATSDGLNLPDEFLALDLGMLSAACSRSVDGLLGADFFRGRIVQIDFAGEKLRILDSSPSDVETNSVPLETRPCGFRVAVSVNGGKSQWVRVDTGCATAFHWVTTKERAERCTSKLAVGLAELSIPQTMTGVRIGRHHVDGVPTGLHRKAIFPGEAGLLGNGFLAQFGVVTLDLKAGRLFLGHALLR